MKTRKRNQRTMCLCEFVVDKEETALCVSVCVLICGRKGRDSIVRVCMCVNLWWIRKRQHCACVSVCVLICGG